MTGHETAKAGIVAECCCIDVGQGMSSIILLGDNRAIIIDCGPRGFTPVRALQHFGVRDIIALIVSHNDADHYGGAAQIIQSFPKQIRQIYFLEDRPNRKTPLIPIVLRELEAGNLVKQPIRLEADSDKGKVIFKDPEKFIALHVLFPWMFANINARQQGGGNRTSAVLALQCGQRRIVFGGDLLYDGWQQLRRALNAPVVCDVLAVPHHGGALTSTDQERRHQWIYKEAIRCETAIISVGSNSQWRHPLPAHIDAIRQSEARVLCTQITPHCCDDLEPLRPGVIRPHLPGASKPQESRSRNSGRSRHVACAGSVLIEIGPKAIHIARFDEHRAAVDKLACADGGHPMCRKAVT